MTINQRRSARQRQRIRARVAEIRRLALNQVPYPRSNIEFYLYLFEAGEISQHQYEHLVFRYHYPLTQQSRDYRRYIHLEHPMENFTMYITRPNPDTYERIIEYHGERLAETNNSLCQECLIPILIGEEFCEECQQEERIIPEWMF